MRTTADPGKAFLGGSSRQWHADEIFTPRLHAVLIHDTAPTEYLAGNLEPNHLRKLLGLAALEGNLGFGIMQEVAANISKYKDNINPHPELLIHQAIPYAAYLLTESHIHRSPVNILDRPVSRVQMNLLFEAQSA